MNYITRFNLLAPVCDYDAAEVYLTEDDMYVKVSKYGKLAITKYERLKYNNDFSLLRINLLTGRKNQIRVHMKYIGHNVVGDKKYGEKKFDPVRRLCLHANYLEFNHPLNNKKIIHPKVE